MPLSPFKDFHPTDCVLNNERIDIWQFPLHTEFVQAKSLLNAQELVRAQRYHFAKHQRRFTVARAMTRMIIARYLTIDPTEIIFNYNPQGKPEINHYTQLQFNLSHSGNMALLAVGVSHPIGIDLEYFSARPYLGIAKEIFSSKENRSLQALPSELLPLGFFHLWAQKEALIKACGLGLSYPTKQFDLPLLPPTQLQLEDPLFKQQWKIYSFMPQLACCAAICFHPVVKELRYLSLSTANIAL